MSDIDAVTVAGCGDDPLILPPAPLGAVGVDEAGACVDAAAGDEYEPATAVTDAAPPPPPPLPAPSVFEPIPGAGGVVDFNGLGLPLITNNTRSVHANQQPQKSPKTNGIAAHTVRPCQPLHLYPFWYSECHASASSHI